MVLLRNVAYKVVHFKKTNSVSGSRSGLFTLNAKFSQPSLPVTFLAFLVDTGSCVSILPLSFFKNTQSTVALRPANGSFIPTFDTVTLLFHLESVEPKLRWSFIVAYTVQPILGSNFFEFFGFLVYCKNRSHSLNFLPLQQMKSANHYLKNYHVQLFSPF